MPPSPTLLSIVALARAGAVEEAWRRLEGGGFAADDPAALTVRGRLLKDRASAASGEARRGLWLEAARAYGRAGEIQGSATYPFINAATLSLLAGDAEAARGRAGQVLGLIERGEDGPETPYWRAATRAEALLLLERTDEAQAALRDAVALAPRAWEDHAATLRQFALILAEQGTDAGWLDALRPPRALHFAGHMAVAGDDAALGEQVRALLAAENIGFGYGALGAGADIVIAEALLEHGAELHLVLPGDPASFAATSVEPFGGDWAARFEAVLARADTVEAAAPAGAGWAGNQVAAEVAMGAAVMQAGLLATEAVQLLVLDEPEPGRGDPGGSGWMASAWEQAGRRREVLVAARVGAAAAAASTAAENYVPAALVELRFGGAMDDLAAADRLADWVAPRLAGTLDGLGLLATARWSGDGLSLAFASPAEAARGLLAIAAAVEGVAGLRAGAHYGPVRRRADPFGGADALLGPAQGVAARLLAAAPEGAVLVSGQLAAALNAGSVGGRPRTEHIGELALDGSGEPVRIFSLRP